MFDFHRHINQCIERENSFYCTSRLEEWNKINKGNSLGLLMKSPIQYNIDSILEELTNKIILNNTYQIGEIGIDKRFNNIDLQVIFLEECLKIAYKYNRILTIHCVKSYDLLINILAKNQNNMPPLTILHGFSSSLDIAIKLRQLGVLISINPKFIKTKAFKNIKEFDKLGFLIESDWDYINDYNYQNYFSSFINNLINEDLTNFQEINNEYSSILKNITFNR